MKKVIILSAVFIFILIQTFPQSAFFTSDSPRCFNDTVHFTPGFPGGTILQEKWDFGDGNVITYDPPTTFPVFTTHLYANYGTYTVNRTVKFSAIILNYSILVQVIPRPVANFSYAFVTCAGQSVQFTDLSITNYGYIQSWYWNFGDPTSGINNTSTLSNPSHTFSAAGNYNVSLTVTGNTGCANTIIKAITISILPVANFAYSGTCEGDLTQFTDLSIANAAAIVSYNWNFGDGGTSSLSSPMHIYATYGVFNVTLTVVNSNGCTHSVTKPVMVNAKPVAFFSFPSTNCMGLPVQFNDLSYIPAGFSGYIVQWVWEFGDGTSPLMINFPGNPNVTHTFWGYATAHVVRLTVTTSNGCTAFVERIVNSVPAPVANFTQSVTTCEQQPVQFYDLSQTNGGGVIISWNWDFGDPMSGINNSSTLQNPAHAFTDAGIFTVTLVVTNNIGCQDTMTKAISVNTGPIANFSSDTVPVGSLTTFTDLSISPGSIVIWRWDFGDGQSSSLSNPTHLYGMPGTYMAKLTVTNTMGCIGDIIKPVVILDTLNAPPATRNVTNVIVANSETKCYNASQVINIAGNGTFFFVLSGGNATFIAGQKISFLPNSIVLSGGNMWGYIAPNGPYCVTPSMPSTTSADDQVSMGIEQSSFKIYPNPTTGVFVFELKGKDANNSSTVEFYGTMGEKVMTENLNGELKHEFNLTGLPIGIYFIRIVNGDKVETAKIIRQ
ncbi:MAG: PKD domain-containing protein [Bacteroidetes bacterium]|nr:PKD domain-containing protein [Bacteroidota bacterium]